MIPGQQCLTRQKNYQRKHVAHVQNCNISGPKVDGSLMDIAVYSVIMLYMHRKYYEQLVEVKKNE